MKFPNISHLSEEEKQAFFEVMSLLSVEGGPERDIYQAIEENLIQYLELKEAGAQPKLSLTEVAQILLEPVREMLKETEEEGGPLRPEQVQHRRHLLKTTPWDTVVDTLAYLAWGTHQKDPLTALVKTALFSPAETGEERVAEAILSYQMAGGKLLPGVANQALRLLLQHRKD